MLSAPRSHRRPLQLSSCSDLMCCRAGCVDIAPLSLHDALPISGISASLRGRRDGGVLVGGGCAPGVGSTAKAVCPVRVDAASGENAPDRLPASLGSRPRCDREARELRYARLHALLDLLTPRLLG